MSAAAVSSSSRPEKGSSAKQSFELRLQDLRIFYETFFPVSLMFDWLSYGDEDNLRKREWSFTKQGDVYIRHLSFEDRSAFREALTRGLHATTESFEDIPVKIDIGAVFNVDPSFKHSNQAVEEKELVFDVDISDYDDVRTCCKEGNVCENCWLLMTATIEVIHRALTEDFGFRHILWAFSGRRGVHCWVCDKSARRLSVEARMALMSYLSLETRPDVRLETQLRHPSMVRALNTLREMVGEYLEEQNWLDTLEDFQTLVSLVSARFSLEEDAERLRQRFQEIQDKSREQKLKDIWSRFEEPTQKIILTLLYPRLDTEVSKQMNHLLKSPFCVHPKTGKVCVPIDLHDYKNFDPDRVPKLDELIEEMKDIRRQHPQIKPAELVAMSRLGPYTKILRDFIDDLRRSPDDYGKSVKVKPEVDW